MIGYLCRVVCICLRSIVVLALVLFSQGADSAAAAPRATGPRAAYVFRVGLPQPITSSFGNLTLLIGVGTILLFGGCLWYRRRKSVQKKALSGPESQDDDKRQEGVSGHEERDLASRIVQLMEVRRLYLRSELKISDLAEELGVSRSMVSSCIHKEWGVSFVSFLNGYRVEHVKRLMLDKPYDKLSILYPEAGFANETSFFRTFKDLTGKTPNEWRKCHPGKAQ